MADQEFHGFVHLCDHGILWASRGEVIFNSSDDGESWQRVLSLPISRSTWAKSRTRLTRRLFRMNIYHVQIVKKRYLSVLGFKRFYVFDLDQDCTLIAEGPLKGKRPLVLCKTKDERLLYGEYRSNPERSPISIWESSDGGCSWRAAYTFEGIRHIHGIFQDPHEEIIWITTGDQDNESAIWRASLDFSTMEKVVEGSQQARAITLEFTPEAVFYGTDTPLETNYLYYFTRENSEPKKLMAVDGSVFHSCTVGQDMFFSTACEPSAVNKAKCASIYRVTEDGSCSLVKSWSKDAWHMQLFQYGQIFFASGQKNRMGLWVTPFATRQDQCSKQLDFNQGS